MGYYDLNKKERQNLVRIMENRIQEDLKNGENTNILLYSSDNDVYIRKNVSNILGRAYHDQEALRKKILTVTNELLLSDDPIVRQTSIYLLSEIGKRYWANFQLAQGKDPEEVEKHLARFDVEYFPLTVEEHIELLRNTGFRIVEQLWYSYMQAGFYSIK